MFYLVMEIQVSDTIATIVNSYTDRSLAEQKYHTILAAAAVSNVKAHSAILMKEDGVLLDYQTYRHDNQPQPEE